MQATLHAASGRIAMTTSYVPRHFYLAGFCGIPCVGALSGRYIFIAFLILSGCATPKPSYDINASESLGRIVSKTQVGGKTQQRADSPNLGAALVGTYGIAGLIVGSAFDKTTTLPVFEFKILLLEGREVVAVSEFSGANQVGECVKVFESSQPTYPRFILSDECTTPPKP